MPPKNKATAFVFPGQGSQQVGMGKRLAAGVPRAADIFAEADATLGFPLSQICWGGPEESLDDTVNTQPALLTHSIAVLEAVREAHPDLEPAYTAGHSLGEFSALVCAGALTFPDALRLVRARGEAMKAAGERQPGGMAAILGLAPDLVESACQEARQVSGEPVQVANDNCPGQIVISGSEAGLEAAIESLKALGAKRVIRLAVSIAAHSPLMQQAQQHFDRALEHTEFHPPRIPVLANVSAVPLQSIDDIRAELKAQLTSPVRWTDSVRWMTARGTTRFLEFGPKDVLTKLVGRIGDDVEAHALDAPESFAGLSASPEP